MPFYLLVFIVKEKIYLKSKNDLGNVATVNCQFWNGGELSVRLENDCHPNNCHPHNFIQTIAIQNNCHPSNCHPHNCHHTHSGLFRLIQANLSSFRHIRCHSGSFQSHLGILCVVIIVWVTIVWVTIVWVAIVCGDNCLSAIVWMTIVWVAIVFQPYQQN